MPIMTIRAINATFESTSSGEFETVDDAYRAGLTASLRIAADEVAQSIPSSIVEFLIVNDGQGQVARGAVAVSTARMLNV